MSDFDGGTDFGHFETGHEADSLDQLHQDHGSEADYNNQFGVYEQDHHAAESTDFSQGHHVEYDQPAAVHYESDDFTNYSHDASVDDHAFASEGSESSHAAEFDNLDALQQRFEGDFASGTEIHGGSAGLGIASS
ncbi:hypothetical protein [Dactylosporangium sp. CA-092794]|uniref:hypothetical protein n=1 Tax=Dactylosporangium sp. CA-092794 TaxID=3239929 RepID=UPI003D8CD49A